MRIDICPILEEAEKLIRAIEAKSWHHSVKAAHACLCAMPDPAWAEEVPGMAVYGPGEQLLNGHINILRAHVMAAMLAMLDPDGSWEVADEWPPPTKLKAAFHAMGGQLRQAADSA